MKMTSKRKNQSLSVIRGAIKRSKDDLHEWSIYRQNLTSSIAVNLLKPTNCYEQNLNLPYGDFKMNGQAIEGVIRAAKAEKTELFRETDTYLKFGLPRITVLDSGGMSHRRPMKVNAGKSNVRKAQSEWDLRTRNNHDCLDGALKANKSTCSAESTVSIGNSVQNTDQMHYASSEVIPNSNGLSSKNSFLQSDRHHAQYFSNLDLFRYASGFNYLRYAKADELRNEDRIMPRVSISNLCVALDERTLLERCLLRTPRISHFLKDVSFTLKGGDTLAILYANETEMRALLEVMADRTPQRYLVSGTVHNNGNELALAAFGTRVAYVTAADTYPWLTVEQTLRLASSFISPNNDAFKSINMIEQLIQTFALAPYRNFLCEDLGKTEKQRLKIAIQILKDTDILLTDNIMKDMDLYDMAFVIDYLRDWAIKLNRIAVMAVQPPTIEILTMFHKVLLIASGRVIYCGPSSQMIAYFEEINFPCPPFKNPCDYYVDLVTHDYLTAESSIESLERIKQLADTWNEKKFREQERPEVQLLNDEMSPKVHHAGIFKTAVLIYKRFFEMLLSRPWIYAKEPIYAFFLSLFVGMIFFTIPNDRPASINARFGFIISILAIFLLPNLFIHIERVFDEKIYLCDDVYNGLYDPTFYVIIKIIYDFPIAVLCYTLYALPAYILSGLPTDGTLYWSSVVLFTAVIFIHAVLWRYISWIIAYSCRTQISAIASTLTLLSTAIMFSGFLLHPNRFLHMMKLLHYYNPTKWAGELLAENEFLRHSSFTDWLYKILYNKWIDPNNNSTELLIGCERKRVLATKIKNVPIYTISRCSKIRGSQAMYFAGLSPATTTSSEEHLHEALHIYAIWFTVIFGMLLIVVRCNQRPISKSHRIA